LRQVSCGSEFCVATKAVDFGVELVEDGADGARDVWVVVVSESSPAGAQDADVDLGIEESDLEAIGGDDVALGTWYACDKTAEPEPTEVVSHLGRRVLLKGDAKQRGDLAAKVAVAEAFGDEREGSQGVKQGHDPRVAETQRRDSLSTVDGERPLQAIEGVLVEGAALAPWQRAAKANSVTSGRRRLAHAAGRVGRRFPEDGQAGGNRESRCRGFRRRACDGASAAWPTRGH